ncbi:MAG TPA: hypothetical protein VLB45_07105 [Nitrosopumilaceae archaeon]|nr:hypothetical protein [Nitrosopumilaceae archaeon]
MAVVLDLLSKALLNTPVGHVEQTVSEILKKPVQFRVIEQHPISETEYIRKIVISSEQFPIILATVKFDSKILPKQIMSELLLKKEGIGKILYKYKIKVQRKMGNIEIAPDTKKITRDYEIVHDERIWFQIYEEIRLDHLSTCKNS